jgi:hypothetical protein
MGSRRGLAAIHAELRGRASGPGRRYSAELRKRIVAVAASLRADGVDWREAGELLGVPWQTLMRWSNGARAASPRMRAVHVAETAPVAALTITTATGLRIDGASLDDVVHVLRALG